MAKTYYRTIWISDVHLCSRDCRVEHLLSFLKHHKCDYLYLVGDFIDVWQMKRSWFWPQTVNNVIQKVLAKAKKGTKVTYIPGNHDDLFRDFINVQFGGVQVALQATHVLADGRKFLILHGDEFDVVVQCNRWLAVLGSAAYDYLISLNRVVNLFRRRLGLPYWSLAAAIKRKVKNAVKYIYRFEEAVVHAAKKNKVDGVICGHIHQPTIKQIDGITYCNTGDWVENCTALVETSAGELSIVQWMHEVNAPAHLPEIDDEENEPDVPVELPGALTEAIIY